MISKVTWFVFSFLLSLKRTRQSVYNAIHQDHGRAVLKDAFQFIDLNKKCEKCKLDLNFLTACKTYGLFPKFLRFKLYKSCLRSTRNYKNLQSELLDQEIYLKNNRLLELNGKCKYKKQFLRGTLSLLKYIWLTNVTNNIVSTFVKKQQAIHSRKLRDLGIYNSLQPCDPKKVIFNFSSKPLPNRVRNLLAFGLDFKLPVWRLNFYSYFLHFETLIQSILHLPLPRHFEFRDVKQHIRTVSYKYYNDFKASKVFSCIFSRMDVKLLREYASDSTIVVTRPDKGKGVVILDRSSYVDKIKTILSDRSKFCTVTEPLHKVLLRVEDKVNRVLAKLKKSGILSEKAYNDLHVSGTNPGILYGLPKIHKLLIPLRPIFAACGTPTYKLAKFLVPILSPLTTNDFSIKNSYQFASDIRNLTITPEMVMASFDVESLFTNIPVSETIDIAVNSLFQNCNTVAGMTIKLFRQILELAVLNSYFLFDKCLYRQTDGVGMGLPLGPTFANLFLCFHERRWINNCPLEFRPVYFRRYVDDCFIIFNDRSHVDKFLNYLNVQHPKIRFTKEVESDGSLPFLDISVKRSGASLETSVYRKPTFTGLSTSFFSFIPTSVKRSIVDSAIFRAFTISSSYVLFHTELSFLKSLFFNNGFPAWLVDSCIKKFLNKQFEVTSPQYDVSRLDRYFVLPYFGKQSVNLKHEIHAVLTKFYPYLNPKIVLQNNFTIGSLFPFKDKIPEVLRSAVIYKYCCPSCEASYVGSTTLRLISRVCQHKGKSDRTGEWLTTPSQSSIRDHSHACDSPVLSDSFTILDKKRNNQNLRILESLYIFKHNPVLNDKSSAFKLNIVI